MPINRDELEKIEDPRWKRVLGKMEEGKFYSKSEMSYLLIEKQLFENDSLLQYLPKDYKDTTKFSFEDSFANLLIAIALFSGDIAFTYSFIQSQLAVGNLIEGFKDNLPYYGKKDMEPK